MTIEVVEEPTYRYGYDDNIFEYSKQHYAAMARDYPASQHGIKIFRDEQLISDCIIIGYGGKTRVIQNSSLIDDDQLLICCSNSIFCLALPDLELTWKTEANPAACVQIFKQQDAYLIHGELQITKLDKDGWVVWEFSPSDIIMSLDGEEVFKIEDDGMLLTGLEGTKYKIDFDGKLVETISKQ